MQRIYTTASIEDAAFLAGLLAGGWVKPITLSKNTIYEVHCFTSNSTAVIQSAMQALYSR